MMTNSLNPLILIAEDDEITLTITVNILERKGYQVVTAENGQQAVDICKKTVPQIILMDAGMPVLDGFDACRKIKYDNNDKINSIPIIIVTALEDKDAINKAFKAGAIDYITKPVNWYILEHRIDLLIKKSQAEKALRENEERFQAIAESAIDAIISVNGQGNIIFWNQAAADVFGYSRSEIIGKPIITLIPKQFHSKHLKGFERANRSPIVAFSKKTYELSALRKNGNIFPIELTLSAWTSNHQRFYSCILRDVTERLKNLEELNKLSTAVKQSPNLVVITTRKGIIEYANPQISHHTGYSDDEIIGKNVNIFNSGTTDSKIYQQLWETVKEGKVWQGTLLNKKKNGEFYWAKESISPIFNSENKISHFITIQEDVTQAKELTEEITYRASHDSLTGLVNRHEFEVHLNLLIRDSESDDIHALCFIDLDRFKVVNDTAGHVAGDELLRQLSKQMKQVARRQDLIARLGGDEFALLLPFCKQEKALEIAKKLHVLINQFQLNWENYIFKVGASIGLVTLSQDDNANEVLKYADTACYAAKNTGRNKIYIFSKDDTFLNKKYGEMQWLQRIEQAIEHNQFCLYAQSIVSLSSLDIKQTHCEILIRLTEKDGSIILPNAFLPAAERFNLATKIDCWVINQALNWFSSNPNKLEQIGCFSINLSGQSLADSKTEVFIKELIKEYQFPTNKLIIEITETAAINNLSQAKRLIKGLQKIGIRFSLDDFGSGLSSFGYLKNLSVDFLKIDGMFVKDIANDPIDRAMVKSINEIGQIMGKKTIAEFVENQQIIDELNKIGVDYAQGYFYSKPIPLTEFEVLF